MRRKEQLKAEEESKKIEELSKEIERSVRFVI